MLKIIAITFFVLVNTVFLILFPGLSENFINLFAVILFSLAGVNLILIPNMVLAKNSDAAQIGSIGPIGFFNLILFFWSGLTIYFALFSPPSFSFVSKTDNLILSMACISVALFIIFYASIKLFSDSIYELNKKVEFKSQHNQWRIDLLNIKTDALNNQLANLISKLAEDAVYLARDKKVVSDSINDDINKKIDDLKTSIKDLNEKNILDDINEIKALFDQREKLIRNSNSKV